MAFLCCGSGGFSSAESGLAREREERKALELSEPLVHGPVPVRTLRAGGAMGGGRRSGGAAGRSSERLCGLTGPERALPAAQRSRASAPGLRREQLPCKGANVPRAALHKEVTLRLQLQTQKDRKQA